MPETNNTAQMSIEEIDARTTAIMLSQRHLDLPFRVYHANGKSFLVRMDRVPHSDVNGVQLLLVATYINGDEPNGTYGR